MVWAWAAAMRKTKRASLGIDDLDSAPESYAVFDLFRGVFRGRVVPGGVGILFSIYFQRVIAGCAFPWANCSGGAGFEVLFGKGFRGEVLVSFDDDGVVAFRDYRVLPNGFRHRGMIAQTWVNAPNLVTLARLLLAPRW